MVVFLRLALVADNTMNVSQIVFFGNDWYFIALFMLNDRTQNKGLFCVLVKFLG